MDHMERNQGPLLASHVPALPSPNRNSDTASQRHSCFGTEGTPCLKQRGEETALLPCGATASSPYLTFTAQGVTDPSPFYRRRTQSLKRPSNLSQITAGKYWSGDSHLQADVRLTPDALALNPQRLPAAPDPHPTERVARSTESSIYKI